MANEGKYSVPNLCTGWWRPSNEQSRTCYLNGHKSHRLYDCHYGPWLSHPLLVLWNRTNGDDNEYALENTFKPRNFGFCVLTSSILLQCNTNLALWMKDGVLQRPSQSTNAGVPWCWRIYDWNIDPWVSKGKGFYSDNKCGVRDEYLCGLCTPIVHNAWRPNTQRSPSRGFSKFGLSCSINQFENDKCTRTRKNEGWIEASPRGHRKQNHNGSRRDHRTTAITHSNTLTHVRSAVDTSPPPVPNTAKRAAEQGWVQHNSLQQHLRFFELSQHCSTKVLENRSRKRVTFAHCLVKYKWLRPTCKNDHLLLYSQDDKDDAQDTQPTWCEYIQYKIEECQSFINRKHVMMRYARTKTATSPPPSTVE